MAGFHLIPGGRFWVIGDTDGASAWHAVRLGTVRSFARYLSTLDPATEIPPVGLLPEPSHRVVPYIYSDDDIARILVEAGRLTPEHRADTYQTLISLVFVTGMRVGEAVRLDNGDVDLEQGILTIRDSKFGLCRFPHSRAYVDIWHRRPGSEKLAWFPLHEELLDARRVPRPPTLLVLGTRLDGSERFFDEVLIGTMATSPPQFFFPGFSRLPAPGRWRLVAVSGPDWGCFEFTL